MKSRMKIPLTAYWVVVLMGLGCTRSQFLNARPSSTLVIPKTIPELQALIDSYYMNETPALSETSTDDYIITDANVFKSLSIKDQNTYIWAKDIFNGQGNDPDWNEMYQNVLASNVILDQLGVVERNTSNASDWDNIKGAALFVRAYQFWNLAQVFAPPYDSSTAAGDLGISVRLTSDINAPITRASVKDTYSQIIDDLEVSTSLLPSNFSSTFRNRPSKPAAFALLARVFLSMRAYAQAYLYADSALQLYSTLMNFNSNTTTTSIPFSNTNPEVLYQSNIIQTEQVLYHLRFQLPGYTVDTNLYKSYSPNDLRAYFYFTPKPTNIFVKSGYSGNAYIFTGLATDEVYLMRSESAARTGNTAVAINDLNTLLATRYKTGTFTPYVGLSPTDLLAVILVERRKELYLRGMRWTDLRRFNKEGAGIVLTRSLGGSIYTLQPNSNFYMLPIPPDVIGIPQNPR